MWKKLTRRDFIAISAMSFAGGIAAPYLNLGKALAGVVPIDTPSTADGRVLHKDPLAGVVFKDPPEISYLSRHNGLVEVQLETRIAQTTIRGKTANVMTYNGLFPAPTISVKRGDRLKLHLKNSFPNTTQKNILGHVKNITNIHTHGWHVSPAGNSDNIFIHINPGEQFTFEYDTSRQDSGTLNYYHPHIHKLVAEQMWAGHAGFLVVEDETDALSGIETHLLLLKDITISGSEPEAHTMQDYIDGKEGEVVMVNGLENPVLSIKPGQVQRWRIVNASTARYYNLHLEGHSLYLIGTDGGLLDKPYPISRLLLTPGERIDLLVHADKGPGVYKFVSLPYDRQHNKLEKVTLLTLSCDGSPVRDKVPHVINPHSKRLKMDLSNIRKRRKIYFIMANGRGMINVKDYDIDPYVITSEVGTYELWEIVNISPMDHPFHQHTNPCQILNITGGDKDYASLYTSIPAWKDTFNIPFKGSATILVPVKDFSGKAVFHCHILQHEDIGMMGIWKMV